MKEAKPTPTKSFTALKASGTAQLIGVEGITLKGSLTIEVNTAKDTARRRQAAQGGQLHQARRRQAGDRRPAPTDGAAPTIDLDFAAHGMRAFGSVTLALQGFAFITGDFAFEKGTTLTITTEDPAGAATALTGEVDADDDRRRPRLRVLRRQRPVLRLQQRRQGRRQRPTANSDAMGLAICDVTFGIALMRPTAPTGTAVADEELLRAEGVRQRRAGRHRRLRRLDPQRHGRDQPGHARRRRRRRPRGQLQAAHAGLRAADPRRPGRHRHRAPRLRRHGLPRLRVRHA